MTEPGLVVVDKPRGLTSHDVVARIRRAAGTKKVGHAGTLDPMATGVLVLGIGKATRILGHLTLSDKTYDATIRLGVATHTDDAEGDAISTADASAVTEAQLVAELGRLTGEIDQVPSSVSAIKVDGQRAYARVRAGEEVALPSRRVTVHSIDVGEIRREGAVIDVDVTVSCSSGTYIRAIARDVGRALQVGGHLIALRRTAVGPFSLADAPLSLQTMVEEQRVETLPLGSVGRRLFPHVDVDEAAQREVSFGRALPVRLPDHERPVALIGPNGDLLALYRQDGDLAVPVAVLL